jgi:hypothetical protein
MAEDTMRILGAGPVGRGSGDICDPEWLDRHAVSAVCSAAVGGCMGEIHAVVYVDDATYLLYLL